MPRPLACFFLTPSGLSFFHQAKNGEKNGLAREQEREGNRTIESRRGKRSVLQYSSFGGGVSLFAPMAIKEEMERFSKRPWLDGWSGKKKLKVTLQLRLLQSASHSPAEISLNPPFPLSKDIPQSLRKRGGDVNANKRGRLRHATIAGKRRGLCMLTHCRLLFPRMLRFFDAHI